MTAAVIKVAIGARLNCPSVATNTCRCNRIKAPKRRRGAGAEGLASGCSDGRCSFSRTTDVAPVRRLPLPKRFFMRLTIAGQPAVFEGERALRQALDEAHIVARNQHRHTELIELLK